MLDRIANREDPEQTATSEDLSLTFAVPKQIF